MSKNNPKHDLILLDYIEARMESGDKVKKGTIAMLAEKYDLAEGTINNLIKDKKGRMVELLQTRLAEEGPRAVKRLIDGIDIDMDFDKDKEAHRLKAALQLLDRIGVARVETQQVQVEAPNGIFMIPAKSKDGSEED